MEAEDGSSAQRQQRANRCGLAPAVRRPADRVDRFGVEGRDLHQRSHVREHRDRWAPFARSAPKHRIASSRGVGDHDVNVVVALVTEVGRHPHRSSEHRGGFTARDDEFGAERITRQALYITLAAGLETQPDAQTFLDAPRPLTARPP